MRQSQSGDTAAAVDWVKARVDCSVHQVWLALCDRVKSDLARWKELDKSGAVTSVKVLEQPDRLSVSKNVGGDSEHWVVLEKDSQRIYYRVSLGDPNPNAVPKKRIAPILGREGHCRLTIDSKQEELEFWQVSRQILEPLLYCYIPDAAPNVCRTFVVTVFECGGNEWRLLIR